MESRHVSGASESVFPDRRLMRGWLLLDGALALHVLDEALTGFLDFYNPLVLAIRGQIPWFPMPTFSFGVWVSGLIVTVIILAGLTPAVGHGVVGTRSLAWIFCIVMFGNGLGHLVGSLYFGRWLPGATSAPLLLLASVVLFRRLATRR